ncbi:MAG: hypothetical protein DRP94_00865 [Candidatus Latescibacterota bacterium]|nr:MAG: hypothetical protein DRP94_00865 [Candidatus Latescibacterota bacterium]
MEGHRGDLVSSLLVLLGDLYFREGESEKAGQAYMQAFVRRLGVLEGGRVIPGCYGIVPQERDKLEALEVLGGLRLGTPGGMLELSGTFWLAGDFEGARGVLEEIVERYPGSPDAGEAKLRLELVERLKKVR